MAAFADLQVGFFAGACPPSWGPRPSSRWRRLEAGPNPADRDACRVAPPVRCLNALGGKPLRTICRRTLELFLAPPFTTCDPDKSKLYPVCVPLSGEWGCLRHSSGITYVKTLSKGESMGAWELVVPPNSGLGCSSLCDLLSNVSLCVLITFLCRFYPQGFEMPSEHSSHVSLIVTSELVSPGWRGPFSLFPPPRMPFLNQDDSKALLVS